MTAWIDFCADNAQGARPEFEKLRAEHSDERNWQSFGSVEPSTVPAYFAMCAGSTEQGSALAREALEIARALLNKFPHSPRVLHDLAAAFAVIDYREQMRAYLKQAAVAGRVEQRSTRLVPRFLPFAADAEFQNFVDNDVSSTASAAPRTHADIQPGR